MSVYNTDDEEQDVRKSPIEPYKPSLSSEVTVVVTSAAIDIKNKPFQYVTTSLFLIAAVPASL